MSRRRVALFASVQMCLGLVLVTAASPVSARTAADWTITTVTASHVVAREGQVEVEASCPSGKTPVSGGYTLSSAGGWDARRMAESTEFGSGQHYRVSIDDQVAHDGGASDLVTATVNCVSTSLFSNSIWKNTSGTVGSDHLATAVTNCDPGWFALSADVGFGSAGGQTLLTSTPDLEFDGWYARGWHEVVGSSMWMVVHCVPASDIPGARVYQHADNVGWGSTAAATCPTGLKPLTGGTYHSGGDGGAVSDQPHMTGTGWTSISAGLGGGTMLTNLICIPAGDPTVGVNAGTVPNPNSTTAQWTFTATDPAAAGTYGVTTTCTLKNVTTQPYVTMYQNQACSSPVQASNLADGDYTLFVTATTGDGRTNQIPGSAEAIVDTTDPVVTFDDPANTAYPAASPAVPVHLVDTNGASSVKCTVDGVGEPALCAVAGTGARTLDLPALADGTHVVHVTARDQFTNEASYDFTFRVDTTPPTVTQTGPASRFMSNATATVTWTGHDNIAGINGYGIQWRRAPYNADFGNWSSTVNVAGTATSRSFTSLSRGYTYCYRVMATDRVGHASAWTTNKCTAIPFDDRDLADSSGWTPVSVHGYFRGTAMKATRQGETLALTGVTLKRVAIVAKKCSTCGVVGVYVGRTLVGRVDLHARTTARKVIALPAFSLRTATVKIKVLSAGKPVFIDALGVTRT